MHRTTVLLVSILCLAAQLGSAQWTRLQTGYDGKLEAVFFTSADTGFIVGGSTVLKTVDGGDSWASQILSKGSGQTLRTVFFPTRLVGYAAGKNVYKTMDGGLTWDSIYTIAEVPGNKEFRSVFFRDALNGYVVGDGIRLTSDGGDTWNVEPFNPAFPVSCSGIDFVGDGVGFIAGWTGTSGGMFGIVAKTNDSGKTWRRSLAMEDLSYGFRIKDVRFITPMNGWIVGSRESSNPPYGETRILRSTDSGTTWVPISTVFGRTLNTVAVVSDEVVYVGDEWGDIYSSSDGGSSWKRDEIASGGRSISSIITVDTRVAYAVADGGAAFKRSIATSVSNDAPINSVRISPSPAHDRIVVSIDPSHAVTERRSLTLFDALGTVVFQAQIQIGLNEFDVSAMARGVYFAHVDDGEDSHPLKLLLY